MSLTIDHDFPGIKSIALQHVFLGGRAGFFVFFTQGLFSAFDFSIGVIVKSFHLGIFVKCVM